MSIVTLLDSAGNTIEIKNAHLREWLATSIALCKPDKVVLCDGSEEEKRRLTDLAVSEGVLTPLNQDKLPGC